jgi:L-2-hydroxyglutarate oxidase LhgO
VEEVSVTIVGAGVVGLAMAAELSRLYDNVVVLEKHGNIGQETSSRNSEVIHAGIYYPAGSLKAALCVKGAEMLYAYCREHGVPHSRIGKLIVSGDVSGVPRLEALLRNGEDNGVRGLKCIDGKEAKRLEPNVRAAAALISPNTGIVDSHTLMKTLQKDAESRGAMFSFKSEVSLIERHGDGYIVGLKDEDYRFLTRVVVNCAGLASDHVAGLAGIDVDGAGYRLRYCKGSYFSYHRKSPVGRLVYPLPEMKLTGLGVHATLDLAGRLRFGPDVEFVDEIDYKVDIGKRDIFYESASRMINGLDKEALVPDMSGIRPRIFGDGIKDFVISHEDRMGFEGLINLIGIESPGLTACLAIAGMGSGMIKDMLH